jgi:hypothetical protein
MSNITETAKNKIIVINTGEGKFECEIRDISLSDLRLDPSNFRLVEVGLTEENIATYAEDALAKAIKEIADWKELKQSILAQGLQEAPYVKMDTDGKYSVREGNRRTLTLRDIVHSIETREKGYEKYLLENYSTPQCIIYPPEMSERSIILHIGQMHVVGKKPYKAFQKASLCKKMVNLGIEQEQVAKSIGLSKSYISKYLWARERLLAYHKAYPDDQNWVTKFSHFEKIHSKKWLLEKWWINPKNQDEFMIWVNKGKIPEAFRIAGKIGLREVIEDPTAISFFKKEGNDLNEAVDQLKRKKKLGNIMDDMQEQIFDNIRFLHENLGRLTDDRWKQIVNNKEELAIFTETSRRFAEKTNKLTKG